jgi:steroid delta-isomerase-like uncharacterized protein
MVTKSPTQIVNAYIEAYNAHDDEAMIALCDENVFVIHHNRDLLARGKADYRDMLRKYRGLMPDKHFANRRGFYVDGEHVIVEQTWYGTSLEDVPGLAKKGDPRAVDLCTCFTVRDGMIVAYHDYG